MSIDTVNEKLALLGQHLPISADGLDQADNQQLLWGYPGILWAELAAVDEGEAVQFTAVSIAALQWKAKSDGVISFPAVSSGAIEFDAE